LKNKKEIVNREGGKEAESKEQRGKRKEGKGQRTGTETGPAERCIIWRVKMI